MVEIRLNMSGHDSVRPDLPQHLESHIMEHYIENKKHQIKDRRSVKQVFRS